MLNLGVLQINALHGTNGDTFLGDALGVQFATAAPDLAGRGVVADEQFALAHDAAAKSRAQGNAEKILVSLGAAGGGKLLVDVR